MRLRSGETVARIPLDRIGSDFSRAELRFEGLRPPVPSFEARVFLDEPHPDARTPTDGNPRFIGKQFFYGVGVPEPPPAGGGPFDAAGGETQWSRRELQLNVTQRFRAYLAQTTPHDAPLAVVTVDHDGNEIAEPDLDLEGVSLVTT
jgi:hypothetical protein